MLDRLLSQAREALAALEQTLAVFTGPVDTGEATIGIARDSTIYKLLALINECLATGVLGNPEQLGRALEIGERGDAAAAITRNAWKGFEDALVALFMRSYHVTKMESQLLAEGRVSIADLFVLTIASARVVVGYMEPEPPAWYSHDFACVRRHALIATEAQGSRPIEQLSAQQVMSALHAVYSSTARVPYTAELRTYTGLLLRRALALLVTPGDETVWDNADYRRRIETHDCWRYATPYLRDVTVVYWALADLFDLASLMPVEEDAHRLMQPSADLLARARRWFRRFLHHESDNWVRDNLMALSLYAGEDELYHRDHRGQHAPVPVVIKEHRLADFMFLTEQAIQPSGVIAARDIDARTPGLHLSLIVLLTFKARVRASQQMLDPNLFVLLQPEMRQWQCLMRTNPRRPMLVLFFSHVQLYWDGRLWLYNNVFEALCAWMRLVEEQCGRHLEGFDVSSLLDDFFRPDETAQETVLRLAALHGRERPALGVGGMY